MASWRGRKILITGAGGFIGSHLAETLVQLGARVRAFVRYTSRGDIGMLRYVPREVVGEIEIVAGDLRDSEGVANAVASAEVVFHLGALIGIPYSYVHPQEVAETNVLGSLNVLMAARRYGTPRVIHTSTSEVYGEVVTVPIAEDHPLKALSPYAASKIAADKFAESFHRAYGLPICTVRPFNTYGPRQSDRAVIPTIISQALKGTEIQLGALWPTRDFTFVRDTVAGFVKAAENMQVLGTEINIGSNHDLSIGDLAKKILAMMNRDLPITEDPQRIRPEHSEVERLCTDNRRAEQCLGWKPTVSLEEGLAETIRWVEEHFDLYDPEVYRI
jgi:NAD dependent epimerase/dehydratase